MAGDPSRPRRRDAGLVALLAAVLVAGLVYYGVRLSEDTAPAPEPAAASVPGSPTVDPTEPAEPTESPALSPAASATQPGTCWDGVATPDLGTCTLPTGEAGLAHVFPSFDPTRARCEVNTNTDRPLDVVTSWTCRERALGQDVLIAYDQVADATAADALMRESVPAELITAVPGDDGGRYVAADTDKRPARITGWYAEYPYVVSVFAPTKRSAERAWKVLVDQVESQAVVGEPT